MMNRFHALPAARLFPALGAVIVCTAIIGSGGCAAPARHYLRAERYRIEVRLDPDQHTLVGRTMIDLTDAGSASPNHRSDDDTSGPRSQDYNPTHSGRRPVVFDLLLHPALSVESVRAGGARVRYLGPQEDAPKSAEEFAPLRHRVLLDTPVDALTVVVDYHGTLQQDVAVGERPGEIHNFEMHAHVGEEGIYLADGFWYPKPDADEQREPALSDFTLIAEPVADMELVAGGVPAPALHEQTGWLAWQSPYPLEEMVLVGGPHEVHRDAHNGVQIEIHLKPSQAQHAAGLIETVKRNLDRYEPLIGRYPASHYAVVDNFFSSGFAFPTFTLLSSAVIDMGHRSQTAHGYIDHEMLHSWWGNGIHVDPRDGNWCEALASYAANYYGYILDGDLDEARRKRRNYVHFLTRIKPDDDKPLGTFGLDDGCGRDIAYKKGAMVFHMLARKIGQERFWETMRRLTAEYVGRYASWEDIRQLAEESCGGKLDSFFQQWVRRGGAPTVSIERARYASGDQVLTLSLAQSDPPFDLSIPVRVKHASGSQDVIVPLNATSAEVDVPLGVVPLSVELDPDYHLFRKVELREIIPTTASTRSGTALITVQPSGDLPESHKTLQSIFESSFEDGERTVRSASELAEGDLADRCVLIVGDAVFNSYVAAFLSAVEFPVSFRDEGPIGGRAFEFDGVIYDDPGDAVLCTIRHPDVPGGGITVVYANGTDAMPPPWYIPMYDRSLVIFKNGRAARRDDFELRREVAVER